MRMGIPLLLLFGLMGSAAHVQAAPTHAVSRLYFDANNTLIGQGLRYCTGKTQHQGVASHANTRWIDVSYACQGDSTDVSYGSWVPAQLRQDFCTLYDACTSLIPWPEPGLPGTLGNGFYSD